MPACAVRSEDDIYTGPQQEKADKHQALQSGGMRLGLRAAVRIWTLPVLILGAVLLAVLDVSFAPFGARLQHVGDSFEHACGERLEAASLDAAAQERLLRFLSADALGFATSR